MIAEIKNASNLVTMSLVPWVTLLNLYSACPTDPLLAGILKSLWDIHYDAQF